MKKVTSLIAAITLLFAFTCFAQEDTEEPTQWEKDQVAWEQQQAEKQMALDIQRFEFEREKWAYENAEKKRLEYESQFPTNYDLKRDIPVYEFWGYVTDTERKELNKIFTIMLEEGKDEIIINISSFGGSAFDGMGVADAIEAAKGNGIDVTCRAFGKIASAAVPIFASGTTRISGPSTMFMVHEASLFKFFQSESKSDIDAQQQMLEKLEGRYVDMLVRNSKMSSEHWKSAIKREAWFTADTALEWGLVDAIE